MQQTAIKATPDQVEHSGRRLGDYERLVVDRARREGKKIILYVISCCGQNQLFDMDVEP